VVIGKNLFLWKKYAVRSASHRNYRIKKKFGVAPQEIALFDKLTLLENLRYFGRIQEVAGSKLEERIKNLLQLLGLEKKSQQLINTYSGGMKRRANLIGAVIHQPEILFLDELLLT